MDAPAGIRTRVYAVLYCLRKLGNSTNKSACPKMDWDYNLNDTNIGSSRGRRPWPLDYKGMTNLEERGLKGLSFEDFVALVHFFLY